MAEDELTYIEASIRHLAVPIESLTNDPANVRVHPQRNMDAVRGSLRRFGQQKPIVVDGRKVVRAGNATLAAARELGWTHIAAVQSTLDGPDATAFAIADNRTAELAVWDSAALEPQLHSLAEAGIDLPDLGFTPADLEHLFGADNYGGMNHYDGGSGGTGDYQEKVVVAILDMTVRAPLREAIMRLIDERGWTGKAECR